MLDPYSIEKPHVDTCRAQALATSPPPVLPSRACFDIAHTQEVADRCRAVTAAPGSVPGFMKV